MQIITVSSHPTNVHQQLKIYTLLPPTATTHGQYLCNADEDVDSVHHNVVRHVDRVIGHHTPHVRVSLSLTHHLGDQGVRGDVRR